jgi:hypothetical protein
MNDSLIHESKLNNMSNDTQTCCNNNQKNVTWAKWGHFLLPYLYCNVQLSAPVEGGMT